MANLTLQAQGRWLLTDRILNVMRIQGLTFDSMARDLSISPQRLHANIRGKNRGIRTQNLILEYLSAITGEPEANFYKEGE